MKKMLLLLILIVVLCSIIATYFISYNKGYEAGHTIGTKETELLYTTKIKEFEINSLYAQTISDRDEDFTKAFIDEFIENADYYIFDLHVNTDNNTHYGYMGFYYNSDK